MLAMPQAGGAGGGAVPRTCWCPASHPAYLRPSRAFGSGRPTGGRGGQLGSGSCCPLQRTALSPPQRTATPCPGFPPALLAPRLPRVGAVDRPHGLVPVLQREQPKGLSHRDVSLQPWLGSARHSLRAQGGSGSGTTRWERCPGPARCPSMVMRLGWDRGVSRSCHVHWHMGAAPCPLPCPSASSTPTRDCLSNQVFTLWDANEPFLGARNLRELVSALQSLTAEGCWSGPRTWWDGHHGAGGHPHGNRNVSLPQGSACLQGLGACLHLPACAQPRAACASWEPAAEHRDGDPEQKAAMCRFILFQCCEAAGADWDSALAWSGAVRGVRSPWWHGWEGLGASGTLARAHQSNAGAILPAVRRVRRRDGHGGGRRCRQQHLFAHPQGCDGSRVRSGPETAAPGVALPGQG